LFPREWGLTRAIVFTKEEYLRVLGRYWNVQDCYTSVYSLPQIKEKVVDTILFEIDGKGVMDLNEKFLALVDRLKGYKLRAYWSGRRSVHVYLDFPPVKLEYPGLTLRKFCVPYLDLVDRHVVGDMRRLIRIPYTLNTQGQMLSCVVKDRVTSSLVVPGEGELECPINEDVPKKLKALDTKIEEKKIEPGQVVADFDIFPPCITNIINKIAETGDVTHAERLQLTAFLMWNGFSQDEIHLIFQDVNDYDPHYTEYQIKSVFNAKLRCYTCIRSRELGICPLEDLDMLQCPWYPSINYVLFENGNGRKRMPPV
jgi:hypothetical protein